MTIFSELVNWIAQNVGASASVVEILLRVTAILALSVLMAIALHRTSAALRHWVWALSLFAVVLLPFCYGVFPTLQWAILPPPQQASLSSSKPTVSLPTTYPPLKGTATDVRSFPLVEEETVGPTATPDAFSENIVSENENAAASEVVPVVTLPTKAEATWLPSWPLWVVLFWAIGTVCGIAWLAMGIIVARHMTRRAVLLDDSDWSVMLRQLIEAYDLKRPVTVRASSDVSVPMTWGLRHPVILVPTTSRTWSKATKRSVLLHELAHIRRGDCLTRLLGRLACVLYWFHPLVWLVDRQSRKTSEQAADDAVLSSDIAPPDYAEQLLGIVAQLRSNRLFGHVVLPMANKSDLEGRMIAILDARRNRRTPHRKTCYALITLTTLILVPCALLRLGYAESPERSTPVAEESSNEAAPKPCIAKLPCGVEVELLGISEHPSKDKSWWRPDGSPLAEAPCDPLRGSTRGGPGYVSREFAVQFHNLPSESTDTKITFEPTYNGYAGSTPKRSGKRVLGMEAMTVSLPDQRTVDVRVRVAAGPWKTVCKGGKEGAQSQGNQEGGFAFSPVMEKDGDVTMTVTHNISGRTMSTRLIAVDLFGKEHTATSHTGSGAAGFSQITATFANLPLKEIQHFCVQTRSYQQAEFRNVSLRPGQKTEVQIESTLIESGEPTTAKESVTEKPAATTTEASQEEEPSRKEEPPQEKPADPDTIIEGVGRKDVRVGMSREALLKALGKPDGDPSASWLKWKAKHLECTFHTGSTVVSEVRFNPGYHGALPNGIKLGSAGDIVLKQYGEPDYVIVRKNGAKEYEYSSKGILFWTYRGKVTQIVVFKPYRRQLQDNSSSAPNRFGIKLSREYYPLPNDEKLTEMQRLYCQWDAKQFGVPDAKRWDKLNEDEKAEAEKEFLELLESPQETERMRAIDALAGLGSKKAVVPILKIAAEPREKNNADRHTACRALGMLGDQSVVPELVHLTYHYNWNTRLWAQISLTRLTGQNFGSDVEAWKKWWAEQDGQPPISDETVVWATSPGLLAMLHGVEDPKNQEEHDRRMIPMMEHFVGEASSSASE